MSGSDRGKRHQDLGATVFGALAIFGVCVLIYALAFLNGREAERRQQTPAAYSQAAQADAQRACAGREDGAAFECIYERVKASQEQARGEQDLSAQQRAATAALAAAVVALITLVVTGIGVWFVKRTLDATLKAVEDTSEATEAMREANEIAKEAQAANLAIGQSQVRAYISLSNIAVCDLDDGFEVNFDVENSGQSPARRVNISFQVRVQGMPFGVAPRTMPLGDFSASHRERGKTFAFRLPEEWDGFINETSVFDITLVATFFDVFYQRREEPTHFCAIKGSDGYAFLRTPF
jgi:hypothetical protein